MTGAKSAPVLSEGSLAPLKGTEGLGPPLETPVLTASTPWAVREPGGRTGRVPCPHASSPGPLRLHGSQSRATAGSCTFRSPSLLVGVWVSQCPAGWVGCAPAAPACVHSPLCPGRAVPAAAQTAPGPSPGDVSGARGRLLLADANLLHPPLSSPSDAHLLPRGCWGGLGACVGQLRG